MTLVDVQPHPKYLKQLPCGEVLGHYVSAEISSVAASGKAQTKVSEHRSFISGLEGHFIASNITRNQCAGVIFGTIYIPHSR